MTFGTVAILGPGLIGGSLALALAERNLVTRLIVCGRSNSSFPAIQEACPTAEVTTDAKIAIEDADVVIICMPIESMFTFVAPIAHLFKPSALVTDVGSVKGIVERDLAPLFVNNAHWIGSHPMAGSEKSGFSAARSNLFEGAPVVITPTAKTSLIADKRAEEFWSALGGRVTRLDPETHDDYVAQISHLPHLIAAALADHSSAEAIKLAGGGFRDTTRVASGSPELWTGILSENRQKIEESLSRLITELEEVKKSLQANDKPSLHKFLTRAHDQRSEFLKLNL
jgi:prephenate dehydrogenase